MNKFAHIELDEKKLAERTLKFIYSIENTYKECTLFINILNPLEKYESLKHHESYLKDRLSKLQFRVDYDEVAFENKIDGFSDNSYEQTNRLGDKMFEIEKLSKEIFWANADEEKKYQSVSNFNCFQEQIISSDKVSNTVINVPYNLEGWVLHYQELMDNNFPEFSEKIVSGKTIIKYRHFKDGFYIGIETNYQVFKTNFKKNFIEEPHHKLIIFKMLDKKKIEVVVTFDKFVHPHFDPPAYSYGWYFYAENTVQVSETERSLKYIVEREFLDDGSIKLSMSEEFGDKLKRHAYFYYDMLYHTTKEYIKFIEDSFED